MMPSDMLEHIYGLLPDPKIIYEIIFLDLLPPAAKDAALQHSSLASMASAADKIVLEGSPANAPAVAEIAAATAALSVDDVAAVSSRRQQQPSSRPRDARPPRALRFLCSNHARWGRNSFRCADPSSCHMKDLIRPRQDPSTSARPAQGNGQAGRH